MEVRLVATYAGFQTVVPNLSVEETSARLASIPYGYSAPETDGWCEAGTAYILRVGTGKDAPVLHFHLKGFPASWESLVTGIE